MRIILICRMTRRFGVCLAIPVTPRHVEMITQQTPGSSVFTFLYKTIQGELPAIHLPTWPRAWYVSPAFSPWGGVSSSVWVHYAPFPGACQHYFLSFCASRTPSQKEIRSGLCAHEQYAAPQIYTTARCSAFNP